MKDVKGKRHFDPVAAAEEHRQTTHTKELTADVQAGRKMADEGVSPLAVPVRAKNPWADAGPN